MQADVEAPEGGERAGAVALEHAGAVHGHPPAAELELDPLDAHRPARHRVQPVDRHPPRDLGQAAGTLHEREPRQDHEGHESQPDVPPAHAGFPPPPVACRQKGG